ncbi:MAG: ABC transporter permease [Anaerolineae bacterium]|nr:ABC transporter permease [Anaerolineae bacterium]
MRLWNIGAEGQLFLGAWAATGTPILFATLGEIYAERAGVLNLGVEGMMLMGAMTGFGVAHATGNPWAGVLAAMLAAGSLSLLHAFVVISLRADQVVSGLALTFVGTGLSAVLGAPLVEIRQAIARIPNLDIPLLDRIPVLGPVLFQQNVVVYIGFILVPLFWFLLQRTRPGLHLRTVGEHPAAADALGINVYAVRYFYVFVGGLLAGLAGASLSLAITPGWIEGMTAGQGWIAVGLVIFAGWNPLRAAFGSYLFGAIRRLPLDLQGIPSLPLFRNPNLGYFMNMLPYAFTIIVLVIGSRAALRKRLGAPASLGVAYVREERR